MPFLDKKVEYSKDNVLLFAFQTNTDFFFWAHLNATEKNNEILVKSLY